MRHLFIILSVFSLITPATLVTFFFIAGTKLLETFGDN